MKNDSARDKAMDKLVEAKLRSGLSPRSPNCLDAEILAAYVERTLTSRERATCELHLASCANCQAQVAALVRLNEADEPAGIQTKTAASAPAAGISWFRWAWAGPALVAMLVMGIYFGDPFRNDIRQTPAPETRIQNPVAPKPANPSLKYDENKSNVPLPPASKSRRMSTNQPSENKVLDEEGRAETAAQKSKTPQSEPVAGGSVDGNLARRESSGRAQNEVITQPPPATAAAPPAQARDRIEASPHGAIATPSVRADLAKKDERGQSAAKGEGTPSGVGGGIVSGTNSNNPSANRSTSKLAINGRTAQMISPQPTAQTANEKTRSGKAALYDDGKAKKEAQKNDAESADLRENDRDKQQTAQSDSISAATEQVMVTSAGAAPEWRVGRHGLIQKLDAKGKWKRQKSGVHANLYAIAFPSPDTGWAVGQSGTILRTTDGGATWSQLPSPTTEDLVQVNSTSDQSARVVTRSGQIFNTTSGGATWSTGTH